MPADFRAPRVRRRTEQHKEQQVRTPTRANGAKNRQRRPGENGCEWKWMRARMLQSDLDSQPHSDSHWGPRGRLGRQRWRMAGAAKLDDFLRPQRERRLRPARRAVISSSSVCLARRMPLADCKLLRPRKAAAPEPTGKRAPANGRTPAGWLAGWSPVLSRRICHRPANLTSPRAPQSLGGRARLAKGCARVGGPLD